MGRRFESVRGLPLSGCLAPRGHRDLSARRAIAALEEVGKRSPVCEVPGTAAADRACVFLGRAAGAVATDAAADTGEWRLVGNVALSGSPPRRLLRPWIRFVRDPRGGAGVDLDDREATVLLDARLDFRILVVKCNDESTRVRAHALILGTRQIDRLRAFPVSALAQERCLSIGREALADMLDPLVYLAKERLVSRAPGFELPSPASRSSTLAVQHRRPGRVESEQAVEAGELERPADRPEPLRRSSPRR